jgi:hypothetical protein
MKKIILLMACLFAFTASMEVMAAKKKEKKEKKTYEWVMPELTEVKEIDDYLLKCDTLYNRIRSYSDSVTFYHVVKVATIDALGDTIYDLKIQDQEGNFRGTALAAMQYTDLIKSGTQLVGDLAIISLMTASATASLPQLGALKAISYGKYIKAGPKLVSMGTSEMKEIMDSINTQRKQIRAVRKYYKTIGDKENPNAKADASKILTVEFETAPVVVLTTEQKKAADEQEAKDNAIAQAAGFDPDKEEDLNVMIQNTELRMLALR